MAGGEAAERAVLKKGIERDHTDVMDRGYASSALLSRIVAAVVLGDRIVTIATSGVGVNRPSPRFINAPPVDVIDRLKPVLLSGRLGGPGVNRQPEVPRKKWAGSASE